MKKLLLFVAFFITLFSIVACGKNGIAVLQFQGSSSTKLYCEIADNDAMREKGLMFRKHLKENHGMIFVFNNSQYLNFWMKNTYIPLDIAYIDARGIIKEIYFMEPLDVSVTYPSTYKVKYALEVNKGWFEKNNITIGTRIIFSGRLRK